MRNCRSAQALLRGESDPQGNGKQRIDDRKDSDGNKHALADEPVILCLLGKRCDPLKTHEKEYTHTGRLDDIRECKFRAGKGRGEINSEFGDGIDGNEHEQEDLAERHDIFGKARNLYASIVDE